MWCELWSIMMFLWDFTFMATIANIWDLWCLIDFYWDYDDVNERIWYVKVNFSHKTRKGYEAPIGSLVITRLKWANPMMCYVMIWSLMINELMMILCGQILQKDEVYIYESFLLTKVILFSMMLTIEVTISSICPLMFYRVSCGILT